MGNSNRNTNISVVTCFDGNVDAVDIFADIIARRYFGGFNKEHRDVERNRMLNEAAKKNKGETRQEGVSEKDEEKGRQVDVSSHGFWGSHDGADKGDDGHGMSDEQDSIKNSMADPAKDVANGRRMEYNDGKVQKNPDPASRPCG